MANSLYEYDYYGDEAGETEGESMLARLVLCSAPSVPQPVFTITEKAPTRAFSWVTAPTSALTFKTLLRHYAKRALTINRQSCTIKETAELVGIVSYCRPL